MPSRRSDPLRQLQRLHDLSGSQRHHEHRCHLRHRLRVEVELPPPPTPPKVKTREVDVHEQVGELGKLPPDAHERPTRDGDVHARRVEAHEVEGGSGERGVEQEPNVEVSLVVPPPG